MKFVCSMNSGIYIAQFYECKMFSAIYIDTENSNKMKYSDEIIKDD